MSRSGQSPDAESHIDPHDQAIADLAASWLRIIARATFIPGVPAQARQRLAQVLRRLRHAIRAEPFDATPGLQIGADLVAWRMASPRALGASLTLLGQRLLPTIGAVDDVSRDRLDALLGTVATGFTQALHDVAVSAADEINRTERALWQRKQRELQAELQHALLHDPITGLPTRSVFLRRMAEWRAAAGTTAGTCVCVLRLSQYDVLNDALGPERGDLILQRAGRHLASFAEAHGYPLAYLGADEFALGLTGIHDEEQATKIVDRMLRGMPPVTVDGYPLLGAAKAGFVVRDGATASPAELLRLARVALGWACADHRAAYAAYNTERGDADARGHALARAMPAAIRDGQFYLEYQPLVALASRRVVGFEALARWCHPRLGQQRPSDFIALAEQTGLIGQLGLYLLERACREAGRWHHADRRTLLSVNLSPAQLATPGLTAAIAAVLDRTAFPAERLQLEITESGSLDDQSEILTDLTALGVRLAIDDLGSGYSNLAYLVDLPIVNVKLASGFLGAARSGTVEVRNVTVLSHIISMCHDLDITVTAEGVESAAQATVLTRLGCDFGQGRYLGAPARRPPPS